MSRTPNGPKGTVITVDGRGQETTTEFIYRYDGIDYPFSGRPDADSIALERTGPLTATLTFRHAGRVIGSAVRTISPDGKELTIRVELGTGSADRGLQSEVVAARTAGDA